MGRLCPATCGLCSTTVESVSPSRYSSSIYFYYDNFGKAIPTLNSKSGPYPIDVAPRAKGIFSPSDKMYTNEFCIETVSGNCLNGLLADMKQATRAFSTSYRSRENTIDRSSDDSLLSTEELETSEYITDMYKSSKTTNVDNGYIDRNVNRLINFFEGGYDFDFSSNVF